MKDVDLIQIVDAALLSATQRSGPHLVCRPGCTQCCHGVFPISHQDAAHLREALQALEQTDPEKSQRIKERAAESCTRLNPHFPGDPTTGILNEDYESSDLFTDESENALGDTEPCPVLDPATGTCDLYEARLIVCRTFGPPMRTPEGNLPPASSATSTPPPKRSPPASSPPPSPRRKPPATKPSTPPTISTAKPSSPTPFAHSSLNSAEPHRAAAVPSAFRLAESAPLAHPSPRPRRSQRPSHP